MNMDRYRKYTADLDFDAASRAMLTQIAVGWVQSRHGVYTGEQDMIAACIECDFCVRVRWRSGKPEALTEALLLSRMQQECKGRQCLHWKKFCSYFFEAGLHWHNFIVDDVSERYPTFRMSSFEERMALKPRSVYGVGMREVVDTTAMVIAQAKAK